MKRLTLVFLLIFTTSCSGLVLPGAPMAPPPGASQEQLDAYAKALTAYQAKLDAMEKTTQTVAGILGFFGPQGAAASGGVLTLLALWKKYRSVASTHTEVQAASAAVITTLDRVKDRMPPDAKVSDFFEAVGKIMPESAKVFVNEVRENA